MNRAELVQRLAAAEALGDALRDALDADARREYLENGTKVSWTIAGLGRVSSGTTTPSVVVENADQFIAWLEQRYPTEVVTQTVKSVRNQEWLTHLLEGLASWHDKYPDEGGAVTDVDGRSVPGVRYVPGGRYRATSVVLDREVKRRVRAAAQAYVLGGDPAALDDMWGKPTIEAPESA